MSDRIQDVLPVAPGQDGIIFQTLARPGTGDYVVQVMLELSGTPDAAREAAAWEALIARHDALRTAFAWKGQKTPLRVVGHRARLSRSVVDLSGLSAPMQAARLEAWRAEDRRAGFELSRAPLLRVTRFELGGGRHQMVVTFHHAALDGWSVPVLLRDWAALYAGRDLPPPRPAREETLRQTGPVDLDFWRGELAGTEDAGRWHLPSPEAVTALRGDISEWLEAAETERLNAMLRAAGLTAPAAVLGAWGLVQARAAAREHAVFGVARSGRAGLPGAETRVGMYLNTLPLAVPVTGDPTVAEWLSGIQIRLRRQAAHEHVPLSRVQAALRRPDGEALLDSAVVFENYPTDPALLDGLPGLRVTSVEVLEQTSLPLTLYAVPGERLRLRLLFDATLIRADAAEGVLRDVTNVLTHMAAAPGAQLSEIPVATRCLPRAAAHAKPVGTTADTGALARIWQALLDLPAPPDPQDNFFDLGGHSLLVIALQERIHTETGSEPEIPDLFRHATLAAQAAHIATLGSASETAAAPRAAPRNRLQQRRAIRTTKEPVSHG